MGAAVLAALLIGAGGMYLLVGRTGPDPSPSGTTAEVPAQDEPADAETAEPPAEEEPAPVTSEEAEDTPAPEAAAPSAEDDADAPADQDSSLADSITVGDLTFSGGEVRESLDDTFMLETAVVHNGAVEQQFRITVRVYDENDAFIFEGDRVVTFEPGEDDDDLLIFSEQPYQPPPSGADGRIEVEVEIL